MRTATALLWLDLETTSLDPLKGEILEVAALSTDMTGTHHTLRPGVDYVMTIATTRDPFDLCNDDDEIFDMHRANGLLEEIRDGHGSVPIWKADQTLALAIQRWKKQVEIEEVMLAGAGVAQFDIHWLRVHLPLTMAQLHSYRTFDISAAARVLDGCGLLVMQTGDDRHRAESDVNTARRRYRLLRSQLSDLMDRAGVDDIVEAEIEEQAEGQCPVCRDWRVVLLGPGGLRRSRRGNPRRRDHPTRKDPTMTADDAAALLAALEGEDRLTCVTPDHPCEGLCSKSWQMCAGCRARTELRAAAERTQP